MEFSALPASLGVVQRTQILVKIQINTAIFLYLKGTEDYMWFYRFKVSSSKPRDSEKELSKQDHHFNRTLNRPSKVESRKQLTHYHY